MIGLLVIAYIVFMWALCASGGAADDVMEAWQQEAEAVSE